MCFRICSWSSIERPGSRCKMDINAHVIGRRCAGVAACGELCTTQGASSTTKKQTCRPSSNTVHTVRFRIRAAVHRRPLATRMPTRRMLSSRHERGKRARGCSHGKRWTLGWSVGSLVGWPVGWSVSWLVRSFLPSFIRSRTNENERKNELND